MWNNLLGLSPNVKREDILIQKHVTTSHTDIIHFCVNTTSAEVSFWPIDINTNINVAQTTFHMHDMSCGQGVCVYVYVCKVFFVRVGGVHGAYLPVTGSSWVSKQKWAEEKARLKSCEKEIQLPIVQSVVINTLHLCLGFAMATWNLQ